jgi:hypothetical protein
VIVVAEAEADLTKVGFETETKYKYYITSFLWRICKNKM